MRTVGAILGGFARLVAGLVVAPFLLGWLALWLVLGAGIGALVATPFVFAIFDGPPGESAWQWVVVAPLMLCGAVLAFGHWREISGADRFLGGGAGDSHGSARFAGTRELRKLERADGLLIGRSQRGRLLRYDGPAHLLTLAPTRAGKGVGTVIPNLLAVDRSVLVIDPKGDNARVTGEARERFGTVHVLDPFGVSGRPSAAYNPLDRLSADSPDIGEDAASLAEALVVDPPGQSGDAHWNEEAKALLGGLIMFCVAHEEPERRTLASVREYLTLPPDRLSALMALMQDSDAAEGLVARAANRFAGKADREAASVLSNAQRHTHFLDSPRIVMGEAAARKRSGGTFRCRTGGAPSQLRDLYGARASTFVANAGVQQVFGVNDFETAKWLSQSMGQETIGYRTESRRPGDLPTTGTSLTGRDLLTPDEIMQLPSECQLLRLQGEPPAIARKLRYYADPEFAGLFTPEVR
ncbi:type IV secretory system conjugative DNA transfer family protein [Roseivivax sediminis]|uniref:Type IV secretion system protein VirD4 n=1 Tax=Roseivivax sediminis TaxID=936889 RepID=A0A1I2E834_9RHOB|nr:type IV secretory system conjugative DNA transfer family protein [Roseivivax sediminis]SFE88863.1 type IV secretion system protein VirD4 [Roseivivax sediminis]